MIKEEEDQREGSWYSKSENVSRTSIDVQNKDEPQKSKNPPKKIIQERRSVVLDIPPNIQPACQKSNNMSVSISSNSSILSERHLKLELMILKPTIIFMKKFRVDKIQSRHTEVATTIMKNTIRAINRKEWGEVQVEKVVLRQISTYFCTYLRRVQLKSLQLQEVPFYIHVYEQFFQQGGMPALANIKFMRFVRSLAYYNKNKRVWLYYQFISGEYGPNELGFFISIYQNFDETDTGGLGLFNSAEESIKLPLPKLQQLSKLLNYDFTAIYNQLKQWDQIDLDLMSILLIGAYQEYYLKQNQRLVDMFNSVDIDHKGFICYDELYLLVKVLELKEFEKESSIIKFFHQESDYMEQEEKVMSKRRFIEVCLEFKMFTNEQLNQIKKIFLKESNGLNDLRKMWPSIRRNSKLQLIKSNQFSQSLRKISSRIDSLLNEASAPIWQLCVMLRIFELAGLDGIISYVVTLVGVPEQLNVVQTAGNKMWIKRINKEFM